MIALLASAASDLSASRLHRLPSTGFALSIAILLLVVDSTRGDDLMRDAKQLVQSKAVLVIAHRGASGHAPENTIPAFELAIKAKADLIELDYYHAADKTPIVIHDKDLDRTTNAAQKIGRSKIPVGELTSSQLRQLDAGSWFNSKFSSAYVPTLDESLDAIQSGSTTLVERKGGDARTCVELLQRKNLIDKVVVQAFDWEYVKDCHRLAPSLVLGALGSKSLNRKKLDEIEATGASIVVWKSEDLDKTAIDAIHRRGFKAWCYTVNDPGELQRVVKAGIDGVITDKPAEIRELLSQR